MGRIEINIKSIIRFIGNALFLMLILVILIDPANTLLHKKDIIFVLLTAYCIVFYKPDFSKLPFIGLMVTALLIPWLISVMSMRNTDITEVLPMFKAIAPTILLLWVHEFDLLRLSRFPVLLSCLLMDILFVFVLIFPEIEAGLYYFGSIENKSIMIARRWFLGHEFFFMYLKSTVAMLFVVTYYIHKCLHKELRSFGSVIAILIILFYFMFSGTRSTMLAPFFLLGTCMFATYRDNPKAKLIFYPILFVTGILMLILVIMLVIDVNEASNVVKYGHLSSYAELFENNPWILLTGQGPGAYFYSNGFSSWVLQTEWTYLDLIRWYGCFSILIVAVFAYPLIALWKHRSDKLTYELFWTYAAYLAIAGTNPLLMSSTGMLAMLIIYSYREVIIKKNVTHAYET